MLAVDDCGQNPDDLFANAQAAEQAGDIAEAERFYRMLMKGNDPSATFNLGNMLRVYGRNVEAEAALHARFGRASTFAPLVPSDWTNCELTRQIISAYDNRKFGREVCDAYFAIN